MLEVQTLTVGDLDTNCYIVSCTSTNEAIIIDPAAEGELITETLERSRLTPTAILLTHAHFDHCLGLLSLALNYPIPTYLHPADQFLLESAQERAEFWLKKPVDPVPPIFEPITGDTTITFGKYSVRVFETPGHTPGGVCFAIIPENRFGSAEHFQYAESPLLFCGDSFSVKSYGDTNHRYSNKLQLKKSLQQLAVLPPTTLCHGGHGERFFLTDARFLQLSPVSLG